MAFSSAVLLGLMGGAVWQSALDVFQIPCDMFSFYGVLWNFAAVGVLAIFYKKVLQCWSYTRVNRVLRSSSSCLSLRPTDSLGSQLLSTLVMEIIFQGLLVCAVGKLFHNDGYHHYLLINSVSKKYAAMPKYITPLFPLLRCSLMDFILLISVYKCGLEVSGIASTCVRWYYYMRFRVMY